MARKNQVILLHGNKNFKENKPSDFVKGELAIEHGSSDAKLFTLNDANEVVTFVSETVVDAKVKVATDAASTNASGITAINGVLEIIQGTEATDGSIAKALKDAKEYASGLADNYDAAGAANKVKEDVIGKLGDASTADTIYGAKKYAEEKAGAAQSAGIGAAGTAESNAKKYADSLVFNEDKTVKFDDKGAANAAKIAVIGESTDASGATTIYGAKKYADEVATSKISSFKTQIDGEIEAIEGDIETLQTAVGAEAKDDKPATGLYKKIADAQAAATSVVSSTDTAIKVTPETATDGHVEYKLSLVGIATTSGLTALQQQVETLIGNDKETSVRNIVKGEIDAQLDPSGMTEAFDTLTTVAEYIAEHKEEVTGTTGILARISSIEDDIEQNVKTGITTNAGAIETLQGKSGDTKDSVSIVGAKKYADSLVKNANGENLFDDKGAANAAKIAVIGESTDASGATTIYGAKKYAKEVAAEEAGKVQTNLNGIAENYIKTVRDAAGNTFNVTDATNNIVDLSTMVIDCGEY